MSLHKCPTSLRNPDPGVDFCFIRGGDSGVTGGDLEGGTCVGPSQIILGN